MGKLADQKIFLLAKRGGVGDQALFQCQRIKASRHPQKISHLIQVITVQTLRDAKNQPAVAGVWIQGNRLHAALVQYELSSCR